MGHSAKAEKTVLTLSAERTWGKASKAKEHSKYSDACHVREMSITGQGAVQQLQIDRASRKALSPHTHAQMRTQSIPTPLSPAAHSHTTLLSRVQWPPRHAVQLSLTTTACQLRPFPRSLRPVTHASCVRRSAERLESPSLHGPTSASQQPQPFDSSHHASGFRRAAPAGLDTLVASMPKPRLHVARFRRAFVDISSHSHPCLAVRPAAASPPGCCRITALPSRRPVPALAVPGDLGRDRVILARDHGLDVLKLIVANVAEHLRV